MDSFGRYDLGYVHGVEQARPIVDLEHRVRNLEGRIKVVSWITAFTAAISAITLLFSIRNMFRKGIKDGLEKKETKNGVELKEGKEAVTTAGEGEHKARKVRRHVRDFQIETPELANDGIVEPGI